MSKTEQTNVNEIFDFDNPDAPEKQAEPKRKRRWLKVSLITLLVLVLVAGGATAGLLLRAKSQLQFIDFSLEDFEHEPVTEETVEETENFLILGSDSRKSKGSNQWMGKAQSDVMMVMQISEDRKHISVMSIPRDSAVEIPGYGVDKINRAVQYGGAPLAVSTVESVTGIRIDHVAYLDFQSFVALTDVVGGVTLTSVQDGTRTYNGKEALKFVRNRKTLPNGDFDRVRRQQAWMSAVFHKVFTREVLTSPTKVKGVYDSVVPHVALDQSVDMSYLLNLAVDLGRADDVSLHFVTAPRGSTATDGSYMEYLDEARFKPLCESFRQGKAWEYIDAHKSDLDTLVGRPIE